MLFAQILLIIIQIGLIIFLGLIVYQFILEMKKVVSIYKEKKMLKQVQRELESRSGCYGDKYSQRIKERKSWLSVKEKEDS